jgi:flagella basal body P-ring formation protein FlgA
MSRRQIITAIIVVLVLAAAFALLALDSYAGAPTRIVLPDYAVTHASIVRLADLLPAEAPAALHDRAETVALGDAPFPGASRDISRERIAAAVAAHPELAAALEIPAVIHVSRWARTLTRNDVVGAVQHALAESHMPEADYLANSRLEFASTVYVAGDTSAPEVTSLDLSSAPALIRARLWIPDEPRITPFWIALRLDAATARSAAAKLQAALAPAAYRAPSTVSTRVVANPAAQPWQLRSARDASLLVHSGKTVTLSLVSPGMSITTEAAAMQSGAAGDQVRVRVLPSGRQFVAKVVGPASVEADY